MQFHIKEKQEEIKKLKEGIEYTKEEENLGL